MKDSYFFVLEGIDGCGKGEQINRLHKYLFELDKRNIVLTTREPTYGKHGIEIRRLLKEDKDPNANAKLMVELYTKDRKDHIDTLIKPVLSRKSGEMKHFVICDRYYHSTLAYQVTQGNSFDEVYNLQKQFPKPTATILLDLKPEIALSRIGVRGEATEKFEKLEFMNNLRENYLKLPKLLDENIIVLNGSRTIDETANDIKKIVLACIQK